MGVRNSQEILEGLLISIPSVRITQDIIEVLLSAVVTPTKVRNSQEILEVIIVSAAPSIARYGPRVQAV